jgi:stearoyl-CoA desaturase (delta-9 desaturase)
MQNLSTVSAVARTVNWKNLAILTSIHLFALPAFFSFSWTNLAALIIGNWIVGSLGVGLGYHRLLTHRSFQTPKWLEYLLTILGTMSIQDSPVKWVATHRMHHRFTEEPEDPHSTRDGFWWAQAGWLVWGDAQDHDEATLRRYAPDLINDRIHALISRFYYVPVIVSAVVLFFVSGWSMVVWGVFARIVVGWHTTWFVNSFAHKYGRRAYDTADDSTNNWFVALLTFGEGWHNNHHAHPTSARHGLKWYQLDLNWITLRLVERLGLVDGLKVPRIIPLPEPIEEN